MRHGVYCHYTHKKDKCFSQANKFIKVGFWQLDRYFFACCYSFVLCIWIVQHDTVVGSYRYKVLEIYLHFYIIILFLLLFMFLFFVSFFLLKMEIYIYCCDAIGKRSFLEYNKKQHFLSLFCLLQNIFFLYFSTMFYYFL